MGGKVKRRWRPFVSPSPPTRLKVFLRASFKWCKTALLKKNFSPKSWNIQKVLPNKDPGQMTTSAGFGVFNEPVTLICFCFFHASYMSLLMCWSSQTLLSKMWLYLSWRMFLKKISWPQNFKFQTCVLVLIMKEKVSLHILEWLGFFSYLKECTSFVFIKSGFHLLS